MTQAHNSSSKKFDEPSSALSRKWVMSCRTVAMQAKNDSCPTQQQPTLP